MPLRRITLIARFAREEAAAQLAAPSEGDVAAAFATAQAAGASVVYWSNPEAAGRLLLTIDLPAKADIVVRIRLARVEETWVLQEECLGPQRALPNLPPPLQLLPEWPWQNIDERPCCEVRTLSFGRMEAFADYVRAPLDSRRLPVVLLSRSSAMETLVDPRALAQRLRGCAHVIVRRDKAYWTTSSPGHLHLRAFGGSIRIYTPGYSDADAPGLHPQIGPAQSTGTHMLAALQEVSQQVYQRSPEVEYLHPLFADLEREQSDVELRRATREEVERQVAEYRALSERDADAALGLWLQADAEIMRLRSDNADLERRLRQSEHKVRGLQHQLNQKAGATFDDEEEPQAASILLLSRQANDCLQSLDAGVRSEIETQLLARLLEPELRASQCDAVGAGSPLRVFPRSKAAGGKRVIWRDEGDEVLVCRIFTTHDAYEAARDDGLRSDAYEAAGSWSLEPVAV